MYLFLPLLVFYKGLHFVPYFLHFSTLISISISWASLSIQCQSQSVFSSGSAKPSNMIPSDPSCHPGPPTTSPPSTHPHPWTAHRRLCFSTGAAAGGRCRRQQWFSVSDDGSFQHMVPTCPRRSRLHCLDLQEREKKWASAPRSALSLILTPTNTGGLGLRFITSQSCLLKQPERNE